MLSFVSEVVTGYHINPNCVRVAVIRYDTNIDAPIRLDSYTEVDSLVQAIGSLRLHGGGSHLSAALNLLRSHVFASHVVRNNTARIGVIITDQLQSSSQITKAADKVKSEGITVVAVGITGPGQVNTDFMYTLTTNNWGIPVSDYSQLVPNASNIIVHQYGCVAYTTTSAACPSEWLLAEIFSLVTRKYD